MIVVGIIALLAAIAVPGYIRSRKRAQATAIFNDARVIDSAIDQYALENNKKGPDVVNGRNLRGFFKPATSLYAQAGLGTTLSDQLGNNYSFSTVDGGVKVNSGTTSNFADIIDNGSSFWAPFN